MSIQGAINSAATGVTRTVLAVKATKALEAQKAEAVAQAQLENRSLEMEHEAKASLAVGREQAVKAQTAVKEQRLKLMTDPAEVNAYMKQRGEKR